MRQSGNTHPGESEQLESERIERLARQLRALGIDPDDYCAGPVSLVCTQQNFAIGRIEARMPRVIASVWVQTRSGF